MMAHRPYESIYQAPPQQTTASNYDADANNSNHNADIYNAPTGSLPEVSLQCIVSFPQLASLLNQFKSHITSGQAAPSGQTVPATLSPAFINGNIDNQVMAAHQQLQPPTCRGWIGKVCWSS